jgi:hypothetical protein
MGQGISRNVGPCRPYVAVPNDLVERAHDFGERMVAHYTGSQRSRARPGEFEAEKNPKVQARACFAAERSEGNHAHDNSQAEPFGRSRDLNAETRTPQAILELICLVAPQVLFFQIPNGGWRSKAEAARFKWLGTLASAPELCLNLPSLQARFIEVKTSGDRPRREQPAIHHALVALGMARAIVRSIDDASLVLCARGVPMRETPP